MDFEPFIAVCCLPLCLGPMLAGCIGGERRFALREPVWRDTDLEPRSFPCERRPSQKEPDHVSCAPERYVSPLAWDGIDNSIFRPIAKVFAVDPPREAVNVNALDEVPDSAWFTNRLGIRHPSPEELLRGACTPEAMLDPDGAAPESWVIDQGKHDGASLGFRVRVGKHKYMFKNDAKDQPERATAASAIGAAVYHAVGFNTSCEQVVYFDRPLLKLTPGLTSADNSGAVRRFDEAALDHVLAEANRQGNLYRMQASGWLPGYLMGPFKYEKTRSDDPNDVIPHEDRRDLRGARLVAAWLNHFDAREQNSMDSWFAVDAATPESSPGIVRHYYLDTSDCFGSEWAWDGVSRRLGRSYLLDWGDVAGDFASLGIGVKPWERVEKEPGYDLFGYFSAKEFDPEGWKNEYPNPAFSRATEHDNAWMARILSRFDRADIDALVGLGQFSNPAHAPYLADVLEQRLRLILQRYLLQLSPLADLRVDAGHRLCATDLARRREVWESRAFQYGATWRNGEPERALSVEVADQGGICVELPRVSAPPPTPGDARERYVTVTLTNGVSRYPLRAYLYDLGVSEGYRLVGIERPNEP
jgi:hypothetical protein